MLLCGIDCWNESMGLSDVVDYIYLASIWATNNLAGIVISVKILGLKFVPYIADTWNFVLETGPSEDDYIRDPDDPAQVYF